MIFFTQIALAGHLKSTGWPAGRELDSTDLEA